MDFVKILHDMAIELVEDKANLKVVQRPSLEENEIILYVYASKGDISKLIGKRGSMASTIRQIMSVAGRLTDTKLVIKFESYDE